MTTAHMKALADTQRLTLAPSEICSGDLMRDLGRLREVERVESLSGGITPTLYLVSFVDDRVGSDRWGSGTRRRSLCGRTLRREGRG